MKTTLSQEIANLESSIARIRTIVHQNQDDNDFMVRLQNELEKVSKLIHVAKCYRDDMKSDDIYAASLAEYRTPMKGRTNTASLMNFAMSLSDPNNNTESANLTESQLHVLGTNTHV